MGDETCDLKQGIKETNSKNDLVENSSRNGRRKTNLDDEFGEQKIPDEFNESHFSETQKRLTTDDLNKSITTISVDALDALLNRKSDLHNSEINEDQSSKIIEAANLARSIEELQRGRVEVIRLQAVSNNPLQSLENDSLSSLSNASEKPTDKVYVNEDMDIITNESVAPSQGEFILAPGVPCKKVPMYITPNIQSDLQNIDPNVGHDLLQTAVSSISENIGTSYQQIMLDIQSPEYTMLRAEKTTDASAVKGLSWATNPSTSSSVANSDCSIASSALYHTSSSETSDTLSDLQSMENISGVSPTQTMERFITADNQLVYGYKDSNGEMHFFGQAPNDDRESHNEKERKRRSRVSEACNSLRKIIPGINEKTDKATVFEQTAKYLKFLRDKFGTQFDQAYCEKYYQRRS